MTEVMDVIDKAIKRLLTPTAMFVAYVLLVRAIKPDGVNRTSIIAISSLIFVWAVVYLVMASTEAIEGFRKIQAGVVPRLFLTTFLVVYLILAAAACKASFDKLPNTAIANQCTEDDKRFLKSPA